MNKNKKIIIITIISLIVLTGIYLLYNTYALTTKTTNNGDYYTINLTDSNIVSLAANEEKTVIYQINNTNNGTVSYGVAYNNSNVAVKVYSDSKDKVTGTIGANDNKYVKLHLKNKTSSNTTVEITAVMGYENGGDLIVPSDSTLVTKTYTNSFAGYITELYDNSTKTPVTNNSITYQYDTTNNLMQDIAGNTRYYGASPKNYIYFNCDSYPSTNCELWRIIGVFDGKVKLIRNESIGSYSWDNKNTTTGAETAYGKNDWTTARLMKLLNPSTYYSTDTNDNGKGQSLYWNATSGTCYSGQNNATISCNFTSTGIKDTTRNMIAEITWNLGGWNTSDIYSNVMYEKERGTTVYSGRSTTWAGKIALAYPSDYGYATDLSKCFQALHNYDDSTCKSNDWMYSIITNSGNDNGWLLFPHKNYAYSVLRVSVSGYARNYGYASATEGVVPVLYLNSKQIIIGGDGSQNNPYQLKA
ncbi:MAG: hypothetical protein SPF04_05685 [Bacilli bacterium]|nr:hypothetical protein [Bacilli bacterium]